MPVEAETENDQDADDAEDHADDTPSWPAARCARAVAASPHLHKKFQMPTPKWKDEASTPINEKR